MSISAKSTYLPPTAVCASDPPTHTFYIHKIPNSNKHDSTKYIVYSSNQETAAYTVFKSLPSCTRLRHERPRLHIYRERFLPSGFSPTNATTDHRYKHHPESPLIAIAYFVKRISCLSVDIDGREIALPSRIRGPWKFARQWRSPGGVARWHYSRGSRDMDMVDEKRRSWGSGKWTMGNQVG
ncbi:MAG: hypothetical protein Q9181_005847 [Wetmoreana brouardii]